MTEFISLFLAARPSFVEGVARIFDFGGTLNEYNQSLTPAQADALAFRADIEALRQDVLATGEQLRNNCHAEA